MRECYRYQFRPEVSLEDVEGSLLLALMGAESLHGGAQLHLDAAHYLDASKRACIVDASTAVGRDLNRLFVGFLRRELSPETFQVERVTPAQPQTPLVAAHA